MSQKISKSDFEVVFEHELSILDFGMWISDLVFYSATRNRKSASFRCPISHIQSPKSLNMKMLFDILGHDLSVEQMYDPVAVFGIGRRVGHHDDGGAVFVELGQHAHHFLTMS